MRDQIIRQAFHQRILKKAHSDRDTYVLDELGLKNGSVRADIAVINGKLLGYEIKTDGDTLARLPEQAAVYSEIFDKAYLITSERHISDAVNIIPNWWGIYIIHPLKNDAFAFKNYRKAKTNKFQNCYSLAQLLWKDEAFELASILTGKKTSTKLSKHEIYDIISKATSPKTLSKTVLLYLKQREGWRKDPSLP